MGTERVVSHLPPSLETVTIENLCVGDAVIDLVLERHAHAVGLEIRERGGDVEVLVIK